MKNNFQLSKITTALAIVGGISLLGSQAMAAQIPSAGASIRQHRILIQQVQNVL